MYYQLTDRFVVPAPLEQTWKFFSSAENLPAITPPWLGFKVHTPSPITIQQDTVLDYTIRWNGVPVRWRTRIIDYAPPHQFIDLQIKGPYRLWHHQHRFSAAGQGGTMCEDRVIYSLPFGFLGRLTHRLMVRRQLRQIFRYRRQIIAERLGALQPLQADIEIDVVT